MDKSLILACLALFTLLAGMVIAYMELKNTEESIRTGEHTDGTRARPRA